MNSSVLHQQCAKLRLLCANDVYKPEKMSLMNALIKRHMCKSGTNSVTKTVFPGDFLGGSMFTTTFKGESMIEVFNAIGFDYVTLGNHEFDYGAQQTKHLMDISTFPWLGSNVRVAESGELFHSTLDIDIFELPVTQDSDDDVSSDSIHSDSIRVGVFGLCTEFTPVLSNPGDSVRFEPAVTHAQRCVAYLRQDRGCDVVIGLTHLSVSTDRKVAELAPGIDLIVGGHDHEPMLLTHHGTYIFKCGQNLDFLGVVDLNIECTSNTSLATAVILDDCAPGDHEASNGNTDDGKNRRSKRRVSVIPSFQLLATNGTATDPAVDAIIARWMGKRSAEQAAAATDQLCRIVGDAPLSTRASDVRVQESQFPCLLADALVWSYTSRGHRCDFCIQNGGFVRGDRVYLPGQVLTRADVLEELPFPRPPSLLRMTGTQVWLALEQMLPQETPPGPRGSFPHLSAGLRGEYDLSAPPGQRLRSVTVRRRRKESTTASDSNGQERSSLRAKSSVAAGIAADGAEDVAGFEWEALESDDAEYCVAVSDFYAKCGGDGVDAFQQAPVLAEHGQVAKDVMTAYLRLRGDSGGIGGEPPGRFRKCSSKGDGGTSNDTSFAAVG